MYKQLIRASASPRLINFVLLMYKQLIREQRYAIQLGLQEGRTISSIARQIGVSKSTVSREVRRNGNRRGKYYYKPADELASVRRERSVSNRRTPPQVLAEARRLLVARRAACWSWRTGRRGRFPGGWASAACAYRTSAYTRWYARTRPASCGRIPGTA